MGDSRVLSSAQAGVAKAIDMLQTELLTSMGLTGVTSIAEIGPNLLVDPPFT